MAGNVLVRGSYAGANPVSGIAVIGASMNAWTASIGVSPKLNRLDTTSDY